VSLEFRIYWTIWLAWAVIAAATVPYLLVRPAPYGRYGRPGWGRALNARLAWVLMEAPSPLGMVLLFALVGGASNAVALVALGLWLCHYLYRAFVFPFLLPPTARPMPVVVLAAGAFFNLVNVYLNGSWLFWLGPRRAVGWFFSLPFLLGLGLFFFGMAVHILADRELRTLRRAGNGERGLPHGPLFRWLSCPNYFGEIVEWFGFALATWSPGGLIFALWTAANLVPRAVHHHRWYRDKFPDYPASRRAVIPFVL
jgi:protein-S-isoprenylcysteine O-methyltransferase Ste14